MVGEETKCQTGTESRGRAIGRNFFPVHPLKSVTSNRQRHTALQCDRVPVKTDFNVQNPVGPRGSPMPTCLHKEMKGIVVIVSQHWR